MLQFVSHESLVSAYSPMFHAVRTLLFKDGITEKSHYYLLQYIREHYSSALPANLITIMNSFRISRHEVMYGLIPAKISKEGYKNSNSKRRAND